MKAMVNHSMGEHNNARTRDLKHDWYIHKYMIQKLINLSVQGAADQNPLICG